MLARPRPRGRRQLTESRARLIEVSGQDGAQAAGVVLVLHGGAGRGTRPVSRRQLSVVRMVPIARRIARAGEGRLAVYRLLNHARGWGETNTPTDDVTWALGEIERRLGRRVPVCLVGHSLGGRAALLAGHAPQVVSIAAVAPWFMPTDQPRGLAGKPVLFVHGDRDRVASIERSAMVARRVELETDVVFVEVEGGKHAMLGHADEFLEPVAEFVVETVRGAAEREPVVA